MYDSVKRPRNHSSASGDPGGIAESKLSSVDGNSVASARNVSSGTSVDSCLDVYGPFTEDSFDPDEALPSDFTTPGESLKARLDADPSQQEAAASWNLGAVLEGAQEPLSAWKSCEGTAFTL